MKRAIYTAIALLVAVAAAAPAANGQEAEGSMTHPAIPASLTWQNEPVEASLEGDRLTILAGPATDLFLDPLGAYAVFNSPRLVFSPSDTFLLSVRVETEFAADYDAGALIVYGSDSSWAKFAYEYAPQHRPTLVSVVTNGTSDDVNHRELGDEGVYLRIAGLGGRVFALHHSTDGVTWHLARYFQIDGDAPLRVGFSSQSPTGQGCRSVFTDIRYSERKLADIRSGE